MTDQTRIPTFLGNMKGYPINVQQHSDQLLMWLRETWLEDNVDVGFAPNTAQIEGAAALMAGSPVWLGVQEIYPEDEAAVTSALCGNLAKPYNPDFIIVGHSDCRKLYNQSNADVAKRVRYALDTFPSAKVVLCIGESLETREAPGYIDWVVNQLKESLPDDLSPEDWMRLLSAYEPIWAINTGKTATPKEAQEMHLPLRTFIRSLIDDLADLYRILYGGSVKPENSADLILCPDVDGALVGGASLDPQVFIKLIDNAMTALRKANALA